MQPVWIVNAALLALVPALGPLDDPPAHKLADCPPAVRKTFQAEAKGAKIESVTIEKDEDDQTVYWADVTIGGKSYAIGVLKDGTLSEMNLAVGDEEIPYDRCPPAVKATFRAEAFGATLDTVGKDMKYGVPIYEAVVAHKGKSYQIVIAEDGTLVEKTLVIDDEEIDLAKCPAAVQASLREQAKGGTLGEITRSTGIGERTYEVEVELKGKVYLVEVAESGTLISKSLEAGED
jgi:hypothetical protein